MNLHDLSLPFIAPGTLEATLGISIVDHAPGRVVGRMPISDRVRQPYGAVHGGAILAMAEGLASLGTVQGIDYPKEVAFGQEINGSLLRTAWEGTLEATATAVHQGRTAWVWDVRTLDDQGRLVAMARCTIAVRPNRSLPPAQDSPSSQMARP